MNTNTFAKQLRESKRACEQAQLEHQQLATKCQHRHVVVLRTFYKGSYSWDYDDWQSETRQCLVCGMTESGGSEEVQVFKHLLNPIRRFEFGDLYGRDSKYVASPIHPRQLMNNSLSKTLAWVQANGYAV
jgi:hypothetical protein